MAWSSPPTWSVAQLVTAAQMQVLSDDLKYLKGQAGAITLEDRLEIPCVSGTDGKGLRFTSGGTGMGNFQTLDLGSNSYVFYAANRYFDGTQWQQLNSRAGGSYQIKDDTVTWATFAAASSTQTERMRLDNAGNLGIGSQAPQGKIHAVGAGGSMLFLSCNAVDGTLQTPVVAGTVTQFAAFWIVDRNNTGGGTIQASGNMINTLGGTFNMVNTDTVAVTVTAGGAITVQRTVGTNGTHQINGIVLFR